MKRLPATWPAEPTASAGLVPVERRLPATWAGRTHRLRRACPGGATTASYLAGRTHRPRRACPGGATTASYLGAPNPPPPPGLSRWSDDCQLPGPAEPTAPAGLVPVERRLPATWARRTHRPRRACPGGATTASYLGPPNPPPPPGLSRWSDDCQLPGPAEPTAPAGLVPVERRLPATWARRTHRPRRACPGGATTASYLAGRTHRINLLLRLAILPRRMLRRPGPCPSRRSAASSSPLRPPPS